MCSFHKRIAFGMVQWMVLHTQRPAASLKCSSWSIGLSLLRFFISKYINIILTCNLKKREREREREIESCNTFHIIFKKEKKKKEKRKKKRKTVFGDIRSNLMVATLTSNIVEIWVQTCMIFLE